MGRIDIKVYLYTLWTDLSIHEISLHVYSTKEKKFSSIKTKILAGSLAAVKYISNAVKGILFITLG